MSTTTTGKLIRYARGSTRVQAEDRQLADLRKAGVRTDDLYTDHGVRRAKAGRPALVHAWAAPEPGDTLVVTTLEWMGHDALNMLPVAADHKTRGVHVHGLNMGRESVHMATPTGQLIFTIKSKLADMERGIKAQRDRDSVGQCRAAGKNLGARPRTYKDGKLRMARHALNDLNDYRAATRIAVALGMSRSTLFRRPHQKETKKMQ